MNEVLNECVLLILIQLCLGTPKPETHGEMAKSSSGQCERTNRMYVKMSTVASLA